MPRPIRPKNPPILALQTPGGLTFGRAHEISIDRLVFELDSVLYVGAELSWRLELVGWQETVMGSLRIDRRNDKAIENMPLFTAAILSMSTNDRQMFEDWLDEQAQGGSSKRAPRSVTPAAGGDRMRGGDEAAARQVLERYRQRGVGQSSGTGSSGNSNPTVTRDPFGLTSELPSDALVGTGREAFRAALRAGLRRAASTMPPIEESVGPQSAAGLNQSGPGGPPGDPPGVSLSPATPQRLEVDALAPTSVDQESRSPNTLDPVADDDEVIDESVESAVADSAEHAPASPADDSTADTGGGAPDVEVVPAGPVAAAPDVEAHLATPIGADPAIEYVPFTVPPLVRVRYTTEDAYRRDWRQHIRGAGLFLPIEDIAIIYLDIQVHIALPSGTTIELPARVVAPLAGGCGVMLDIDPATKRLLEDEAAP